MTPGQYGNEDNMMDVDREYLDLKFAAMEARLEAIRVSYADHETRLRAVERIADAAAMYKDHETRLRAIEKTAPWQWIAQAAIGIAAALGIKTGL